MIWVQRQQKGNPKMSETLSSLSERYEIIHNMLFDEWMKADANTSHYDAIDGRLDACKIVLDLIEESDDIAEFTEQLRLEKKLELERYMNIRHTDAYRDLTYYRASHGFFARVLERMEKEN